MINGNEIEAALTEISRETVNSDDLEFSLVLSGLGAYIVGNYMQIEETLNSMREYIEEASPKAAKKIYRTVPIPEDDKTKKDKDSKEK